MTLGHATVNITTAQSIGYVAALLVFVSFWMKTMIPLRLIGILSNMVFIVYGYLGAVYPPLILHLVLLPLNAARLREMIRLTRQVEQASKGDLNMEWIRPFSSTRHIKAGTILFRKGEIAEEMFFVVSGRYLLVESGGEVAPGRVIGELGMVAPDKSRTQTFQCVESGDVLSISYDFIIRTRSSDSIFCSSPAGACSRTSQCSKASWRGGPRQPRDPDLLSCSPSWLRLGVWPLHSLRSDTSKRRRRPSSPNCGAPRWRWWSTRARWRPRAGPVSQSGSSRLHLTRRGSAICTCAPSARRAKDARLRKGRLEEMLRIYEAHIKTPDAQEQLDELIAVVRSGQRVCLLCYERDVAQCHRRRIAELVCERTGAKVENLAPPLF